jgi:hypothetical protein
MTRQPTAKQVLLAHVLERHRGITPARSMTHDQLMKAHAHAHFRYSPDHLHAAPGEINRGADARPAGWYTGLDVVERKQGYLKPSFTFSDVRADIAGAAS